MINTVLPYSNVINDNEVYYNWNFVLMYIKRLERNDVILKNSLENNYPALFFPLRTSCHIEIRLFFFSTFIQLASFNFRVKGVMKSWGCICNCFSNFMLKSFSIFSSLVHFHQHLVCLLLFNQDIWKYQCAYQD